MYSRTFRSAVGGQVKKNNQAKRKVTQLRKNPEPQQKKKKPQQEKKTVGYDYSFEKWVRDNDLSKYATGTSTQTVQGHRGQQVQQSIEHDKSKVKDSQAEEDDEMEEQVPQDYSDDMSCLYCGGFCQLNSDSICSGYNSGGHFDEDVTDPLAQPFDDFDEGDSECDESEKDQLMYMSTIDTSDGRLPMIYRNDSPEDGDAEYSSYLQLLQPLRY